MAVVIVICSLLLAALVVMLISAPLRAASRPGSAAPAGEDGARAPDTASAERRAELEAAREAKYREIRDAELDYRTGKLTSTDYGVLDAQLRSEALTILDEIEALGGAVPEG